jgi:GT2 family glycosyltransferase
MEIGCMVYVLIPAHNNKREVLEVLDCLKRQSYSDNTILLVDDGSTDGTEEEVKRSCPHVVILKGDGNLWWAGANVLGVNYILQNAKNRDFVLLLNNDVLIDSEYISRLVEASVKTNRSLVGSTTVDVRSLHHMSAGLRLDSYLNIAQNTDEEVIKSTDIDSHVDVLSGRGTLIPIEVFKAIGNFDQKRLPHYGADYEFSIRARRAGFKLVTSHLALVYAKHDITGIHLPNKPILALRECFTLLFSKKSSANLRFYLTYVWLCSETEFRVRNTFMNAVGILMQTIFRTLPGYPIYILGRIFLFTLRVLFRRYDFTGLDVEMVGLNEERLLREGIIRERRLRHKTYYYFPPREIVHQKMRRLSPREQEGIVALEKLSLSYLHKMRIAREQLQVLFVRVGQ